MLPQEESGSLIPKPRKLSDDSIKIDVAIVNVAAIIMVDKMLGMICLTIIISDFCPDTFAYKTYSRSFTDNVSALTIRAVSIHVSNPIIRTSVVIPGFKYAFNSSIKRMMELT